MNDQTISPLRHPNRFFIGGSWLEPSSDALIEVVTPSTEEVFYRVAEAQEVDVDRAVAAARTAFDQGAWPRLKHSERADYLRKIGDALIGRASELGRLWSAEMGIVHSAAGMVAPRIGAVYKKYANLAESFAFEERRQPTTGGAFGLLVREPVGVVGAIIPWNAPAALIAHKVAPALLAGCTVIVKASPEAPSAAYLLAEVAEAVGLPHGVINVITADRAVSERLVTHPGVDKISFTGSTAAGRRIGALCGDRVARCTLELGGKSAAVILDDYDVATAAASIAGPACSMSGQVCSSLTRIIVTRRRHDALVEALASQFAAVRVGDPFDPETGMGPLVTGRQRDRVEGYIRKGLEEGATLAAGGERPAHLNRGFYLEPTVFGNVSNSHTIAREEIFGPVLSVIPAESEEQAIEIANDTPFGLNASVFTDDVDRAYAVSRRLLSGTVGHNAFRTDFGIAFGGFKQSGIGREGGREGLLAYLETKTVILDAAPSHMKEAQLGES